MLLELVPEDAETRAARLGTPKFTSPPITASELQAARSSPAKIVDRLFFADVGTLIAPGGVGKTTLMLHIAAHICIGRDVLGEPVRKPGPVLLVTAEDSREILVARLRSVMDAMVLSDIDRATVMDGVRIADVSGVGFKLTEVVADVVLPSDRINDVIAAAREIKPVLIVIDPAVSFGVGEMRVNDAEQGLIEAGRKLRNALECCVLYVHHSGKANGRERTTDQYSGRGGSAFADGSRMVLVLQNMTATEWHEATGEELANGETGLILARPKMSYCAPPDDMLIRRTGFHFERVARAVDGKASQIERHANQVLQLLVDELKHGRLHSKNTIEHADAGSLTRTKIRAALAWLEATGRVEERKRSDTGKGGARSYLHPIGSPDDIGEATPKTAENDAIGSPDETAVIGSPPLREINGGEAMPPVYVPLPFASPNNPGEPMANLAKQRNDDLVEDDL